jgi:hypothetical protein
MIIFRYLNSILQWVLGRSDIYIEASLYMRRWRQFWPLNTRWWGLFRVHNIRRSDADCEPHDHPFSFVSIILWRGYIEKRYDPQTGKWSKRFYGPGSILFRRHSDAHLIELLPDPAHPDAELQAWTLVFRGPLHDSVYNGSVTKHRGKRLPHWGFWEDGKWVHFIDFVAKRKNAQVDAKRPFSSKASY